MTNLPSDHPNFRAPKAQHASTRTMHLGLDWGTSSTKMVLRDYSAPGGVSRAFVLTPEGGGWRYPSTVALHDGRLWFGHEAEDRRAHADRIWDSLKSQAVLGEGWSSAAGVENLNLMDLVTLSLTHYVACAWCLAEQYAKAHDATPKMGMMLSVPLKDLQIRHPHYMKAVVPAYRLGTMGINPQGALLTEILPNLYDMRLKSMSNFGELSKHYDRWLRAEVVAAMVWPFMAHQIETGPYTVLDIGAATTNASFFRIADGHNEQGTYIPKSRMDFYGAATQSPGMDQVDHAISQAHRLRTYIEARGKEDHLYRDPGPELRSRVAGLIQEIKNTWDKARKAVWNWQGGNSIELWDGLKIILAGGGSKVNLVARHFNKPTENFLKHHLKRHSVLRGLSAPNDLFRWTGQASHPQRFTDEHTFMMVAYGLSYRVGDLPDIGLPGSHSPFRNRLSYRPFETWEEKGYSGK